VRQKYSENYFDIGIIAVEISRASLTTTVLPFLFLLFVGPYAASSTSRTCGTRPTGKGQLARKLYRTLSYIQRILLFLFYSYVKSHLDNHVWIPIYKTIPAICNTPRQTQCLQNSIFRTLSWWIVLWAKLWFVVICWNVILCWIEGVSKIFRKLLRHRNHGSGNITHRPDNYSTSFLFLVTFAGPMPMPWVLGYLVCRQWEGPMKLKWNQKFRLAAQGLKHWVPAKIRINGLDRI